MSCNYPNSQNIFSDQKNFDVKNTQPFMIQISSKQKQINKYPQTHLQQMMQSSNSGHHNMVQWLQRNYEAWQGVSIPRRSLYKHYLDHCYQNSIDAMNPASFGKLIRSVFTGLSTRRLGTRGNSQYHYYGIRIKASSHLNQLQSSNYSPPPNNMQSEDNRAYIAEPPEEVTSFDRLVVPPSQLPDNISQADVEHFEELYKEFCEAFLEIIMSLKFSLLEHLCAAFWRCDAKPDKNIEYRLPSSKLMLLSEIPSVLQWVRSCDLTFLQHIINILFPDVLQPLPSSLLQSVRALARKLLLTFKNLATIPPAMLKVKMSTARLFGHHLRRLTCLNHVAQAATAVLCNQQHTQQMLSDLSNVNLSSLQAQCSWVGWCDNGSKLQCEFSDNLQSFASLRQWTDWLEGVVDECTPATTHPSFHSSAKTFLLKWSYYSSSLMRDLTLRSACSFGSFHLTRLLFDDFLMHCLLEKTAQACKQPTMAVIDVCGPEVKKEKSEEGAKLLIKTELNGDGAATTNNVPTVPKINNTSKPIIIRTYMKNAVSTTPNQSQILKPTNVEKAPTHSPPQLVITNTSLKRNNSTLFQTAVTKCDNSIQASSNESLNYSSFPSPSLPKIIRLDTKSVKNFPKGSENCKIIVMTNKQSSLKKV